MKNDKKKHSAIFMGSKPGSVVALSILLDRGWDVKFVVTSPKYEYAWLPSDTLSKVAKKHGLQVITSQKQIPNVLSVDFVISYMFRYLIKTNVLNIARRGAFNFHAGPLPEYGGWTFYNVAIIENASEYGCTCHYMDEGFDTGPLFKVRRFPINASMETAVSLEKKAQIEMIKLFIDFCEIVENQSELPYQVQDKSRMRYLNREEFEKLKQIPIDADYETVDRIARAFWYPPYECAYLKLGDNRIEVLPKIVKKNLAALIHKMDLVDLYETANNYKKDS